MIPMRFLVGHHLGLRRLLRFGLAPVAIGIGYGGVGPYSIGLE